MRLAIRGPRAHSFFARSTGVTAMNIAAIMQDADVDHRSARLRAFRIFLLLFGLVRSFVWVRTVEASEPGLALAAGLFAVGFLFSLTRQYDHFASRLAVAAMAYQIFYSFPFTANHNYLEFYCYALLCLVGRDDEKGEELALVGLRWLTVIVLIHTGLQKLSYGYYFNGELLAFLIGAQERFSGFFAWFLPAAEIERLQSYNYMRIGSGPVRVSSPMFVLVSNLVWISEIVLPFLIVWRRTRWWAILATIVLVVVIQFGALEIGFGLLFVNLLLLFLSSRWQWSLFPVCAALLLFLALAAYYGLSGPLGINV